LSWHLSVLPFVVASLKETGMNLQPVFVFDLPIQCS
jgi:hypothetical protein